MFVVSFTVVILLPTVVQVFLTFVKMITKNFVSGTCKLLIEALRFVCLFVIILHSAASGHGI